MINVINDKNNTTKNINGGGIFHCFNRGTDKRKIFMEDQDYLRFIHDLFEFNDEANVLNLDHNLRINGYIDVGRQYIKQREARKLLVKILAFCLMPNHYHLILKPVSQNGISLFMKKVNGGYAKYFNLKYKRSGTLFQGKYKSKELNEDLYLTYLPHYIHANPLDLFMPEWRNQELPNLKAALNFLESYRWSSYLDYIDIKNFPSVTQREFLIEYYKPEFYKNHFEDWLKGMNLGELKPVMIE